MLYVSVCAHFYAHTCAQCKFFFSRGNITSLQAKLQNTSKYHLAIIDNMQDVSVSSISRILIARPYVSLGSAANVHTVHKTELE